MFPNRNVGGFTLIEVLVALAIFALCATVLTTQSTVTLHNHQSLIEKQLALWIAQNQMTELHIRSASDRMNHTADQQLKVDTAGIEWEVLVTRKALPDSVLDQVTISVTKATPKGVSISPRAQMIGYVEK